MTEAALVLQRAKGLLSSSGLSPYPTATIPDRSFADAFYDFDDADAVITITDEVVTVPAASGFCELRHYPIGGLTDTSELLIEDAAENQWTCQLSDPTGTGEVRVYPGTRRLDFHSDDYGATLYATYQTAHTGITAADLAYQWDCIKTLMTELDTLKAATGSTGTATAGDAIDNQFVRLGNDSLLYVSDPSLLNGLAIGFAEDSYTAGQTVTFTRFGLVTVSGVTLPLRSAIWAGENGKPTYEGDVSGNEVAAGSGHWRQFAGLPWTATSFWLNLGDYERKM